MMKLLSRIEIKECLINLLKDFDSYCRVNNLIYYISCGTLLGAIRHKGFIPWDDDIDICMPRKDYERLQKLSLSWNQPFGLLCYETEKRYTNYFAKIYDKNTVVNYEHSSYGNGYGLFIDVFPLDYYPRNINVDRLCRKMLTNIKMLKMSNMDSMWSGENQLKNLIKRIAFSYAQIRGSVYWLKKIRKQQLLYADENLQLKDCLTIHCATSMKGSIFGNGKDIDFENILVRAPEDPEGYLKKEFGDYLTLPPIEKRISNHDFIVEWKK